jgi:hypothetical protein
MQQQRLVIRQQRQVPAGAAAVRLRKALLLLLDLQACRNEWLQQRI